MSRKDTIIIAALINTALLAVLFMMAVHNNVDLSPDISFAEDGFVANYQDQPKSEEDTDIAYTHVATRDEIDKVLKDYTLNEKEPVVIHQDQIAPPVVEKKQVENKKKYVEVVIKRGDYLEKIARTNGTTVSSIMRENNLPSPRIDVGQLLKIPVNDKGSATIPSEEPKYHTMKVGDNPWKIAKQFNVRFDELLKLNDLDEARARSLKPGDKIRVR